MKRARPGLRSILVACCCAHLASSGRAFADDVVLKNGLVVRGSLDKDNTLRMVTDGLRRVFLRDSKIQSITPSEPFRNLERFLIVQPLEVHAGAMPVYAIDVKATPWNEKGRRSFSYVGPRSSRPVAMTQAINDLGPFMVKFRGIDGFWVSQVTTQQVPRAVVLGLLGRVDRKILNERQRVARFLLQAGWLDEASAEVESIARDFPDERDRSKGVVEAIQELEARKRRLEISVRTRAQQPKEVRALLKSFPTEGVPSDVEIEIRDLRKGLDDVEAADRRLAESFREGLKGLATENEKSWKDAITEILKNQSEAPDAVRDRLEPFRKADPSATPETKLALAVSGWVAGPELASTDLSLAAALWKARGLVRDYLVAKDDKSRQVALDSLQLIERPKDPKKPDSSTKLDLDTVSRMIPLMVPPFAPEAAPIDKPAMHRVLNDNNPEPTDYMVYLPPEYHPLRNYPAIVALHDGNGPKGAIDWWKAEAARHGFIVIAPEYFVPNQPKEYRYSTSEHAAIELALRDARKRYSVDSNRVFLAGSMLGGNIAIDFGMAHPDLFAGVASVSGLPAKFAFAYKKNVSDLPMYLALGDLAPGNKEVMFEKFAKPMITEALDVLYVEYVRRAHEDIPEEAGSIIEWMEKYRRDPVPKAFEALTARPSDARYWGVVVQELATGRSIAPEAAEADGRNIKPARIQMTSSHLSNLINVSATGVNRLDVWVSPKLIDFNKKMEIRINKTPYFKGMAKPDFGPILTDLRFRGDRQQLYWLKVSAGR